MKNKSKYVSKSDQYKEVIKKTIKRNKKRFLNRRIVIWGITEFSANAIETLRSIKCDPVMVVDNSDQWQNTKWMGYLVCPLSAIDPVNDEIIISCTPYKYDKYRQLEIAGIKKSNCFIIDPPREGIIRRYYELVCAWHTYESISEKCKGMLLLCPFPGTGDAFLTGRYLSNFVDKKGVTDYTILCVGGAFKKVMALYGYDNCEVISKKQCADLTFLVGWFGARRLNLYYMLYWGMPNQDAWRLELEYNISFDELFKHSVFGGCEHSVSVPAFIHDDNKVDDIMKEKGLVKDKTIILFPYANSFCEELQDNWWEELSKQLKNKGFCVATNCGSDKEAEVAGTVRLSLPYKEFAMVAEACGYMLGVRSGIFDLMSGVNCRKIIIYQDFMNDKRVTFFSLKNMGLCDDVSEIKLEISSTGADELLKKVVDCVDNAVG